jgi:hypothetical protein
MKYNITPSFLQNKWNTGCHQACGIKIVRIIMCSLSYLNGTQPQPCLLFLADSDTQIQLLHVCTQHSYHNLQCDSQLVYGQLYLWKYYKKEQNNGHSKITGMQIKTEIPCNNQTLEFIIESHEKDKLENLKLIIKI